MITDFDAEFEHAHEFGSMFGWTSRSLVGIGVSEQAWDEFDLGPVDHARLMASNVWLYVGITPVRNATAAIQAHLTSDDSARSAVRRGLIALLHDRQGWQLTAPTGTRRASYRLVDRDEARLNEWIAENVLIAQWFLPQEPPALSLEDWHRDVLRHAAPLLNSRSPRAPERAALDARRRHCIEIVARQPGR